MTSRRSIWAVVAVLVTWICPTTYGQSFFLVDSSTNKQVAQLRTGDAIPFNQTPVNFNVQYVPPATLGQHSVVVTINGVRKQSGPEGNPPFSVFGDTSGTFKGSPSSSGVYTVAATAYADWGTGKVLDSSSVTFTLRPKPVADDSTTLNGPPWGDNKITVLSRGTTYYVAKGWGKCSTHNWTMCASLGTGPLPKIVFTDPTTDARLMEFSSTSSGNILKDFDVLVAPDVTTRRGGFTLGGSFNTLDNIGMSGGDGPMFFVKDEDNRSLHLFNLRTFGDIGGYFIWNGSTREGQCQDFIVQGIRVNHAIASPRGIAHALRCYDITGGTLKDNVVDVRSSVKYAYKTFNPDGSVLVNHMWPASTSGLRLHRGHNIHVVGGDYAGFQSWISPLNSTEPPLYDVTLDGVTFRNSINVGDSNGKGIARNIVFNDCTFITGSNFCLSLGPGTSGQFNRCKFITTAGTPVFGVTPSWTFTGCTRNGAAWR